MKKETYYLMDETELINLINLARTTLWRTKKRPPYGDWAVAGNAQHEVFLMVIKYDQSKDNIQVGGTLGVQMAEALRQLLGEQDDKVRAAVKMS